MFTFDLVIFLKKTFLSQSYATKLESYIEQHSGSWAKSNVI